MSSEWKIPAYQKMVFNAKPEGRRGVGRPRLRWLDDEADIKALGVERWRIKAQDRKEWSAIIQFTLKKYNFPLYKLLIFVDCRFRWSETTSLNCYH
jgi:hypothetical protein